MSEEEKLQLENECLLKYSKAQMIKKYIDELEENCTLSDLWCKSQEENKELKNKIEVYKDANEYHQNIIHELETMKQPNQLHSENVRLRAENKRLNNIINELEKGIKENIEELEEHQLSRDRSDEDKEILRFLQELKGDDK